MDTAIASAVSYASDVKTKMESLYRIVQNATSVSDRAPVVSTFDDKKESAPTYTGNERLDKIIGRFIEIGSKWSNLIISFILSCIIANELIMYPSVIRFAFFVFTFFMCYSFVPYKGFIIFYYFAKWVYNRFLSDKEIVGNLSLPKIYSILPLIYHKSDEPVSMGDKILNGLKIVSVFYPRYEDIDALKETMEKYKTELKASFPYYETVKSVAEIKGLEVAMNAYLDGIHTESKPRTEAAEEAAEEEEAAEAEEVEEKKEESEKTIKELYDKHVASQNKLSAAELQDITTPNSNNIRNKLWEKYEDNAYNASTEDYKEGMKAYDTAQAEFDLKNGAVQEQMKKDGSAPIKPTEPRPVPHTIAPNNSTIATKVGDFYKGREDLEKAKKEKEEQEAKRYNNAKEANNATANERIKKSQELGRTLTIEELQEIRNKYIASKQPSLANATPSQPVENA
uniref:Uncharacterized protein n=1 Tax=viral metagenome TaxID=1070528 RepID=A0A6C0HK84_9ZZZZ